MLVHQIVESAAATPSPMNAWQAIALFGGIPVTVCAIATLAVYLPDWQRARATAAKPTTGHPGDGRPVNHSST